MQVRAPGGARSDRDSRSRGRRHARRARQFDCGRVLTAVRDVVASERRDQRGTSRCIRIARNSTAGPDARRPRGAGSGLWPHSPAIALAPATTRPFTTRPPPVPVPMITPNTTAAPRRRRRWPLTARSNWRRSPAAPAAPARARDRSSSGRPMSQVELAFLISPVAGEIAPGMPMPTVARACRAEAVVVRCFSADAARRSFKAMSRDRQSRERCRRNCRVERRCGGERARGRHRRARDLRFSSRRDRGRCAITERARWRADRRWPRPAPGVAPSARDRGHPR